MAALEHYRRRFASAGPNLRFDPRTSSFSYEQTRIGANVYIGPNARFNGPVVVGNDVMFGPDVHVRAGGHRFDLVGSTIEMSGPDERSEITICDDVWVAGRVTILRGVRIGEGTVVANGSIVTHDLPPYTVAIGVPCRAVRKRFEDDELREHLRLRGRRPERAEALLEARERALSDYAPTDEQKSRDAGGA